MRKCVVLLIVFLAVGLFPQGINDLIPRNEAFFIQSSLNAGKDNVGCWDISGGESKIKEGADIQVWELVKYEKDRKYAIESSPKPGFVRIHLEGIAGYLTVKGGKEKNGTRLEIQSPDNSENQNFSFRYMGNSRFKIVAENGMIITLENRSSKNGKAIQMWEDHDGAFTEWCLIGTKSYKMYNPDAEIAKLTGSIGDNMKGIPPVYIQSALSYGKSLNGYFDVPGTDDPTDGDNIQVYRLSDFNSDRTFTVLPSNSSIPHYSIAVADDQDLLLEAAEGGKTANGNVVVKEIDNSPGQNFYFKHMGSGRYKIYTQNGKVIALKNKKDDNKSNVLTCDDADGEWMEWYLIDAETNKPVIPPGLKGGFPDSKDIVIQNSPDPKITSLAAEIDKLYATADKEEKLSSEVIVKLLKSGTAISEARKVSVNVNSLHSKTKGISDAMVPFKKLPVIGTGVTSISAGLDMGLDQLGKINTALSGVKNKIIDPAADDMEHSVRQNILLNSQLSYLKLYLYRLKQELAAAAGKSKEGYTLNTTEYISEIGDLTVSFASIDKNLREIGSNCAKLRKIEEPSKTVSKGVKKFDKSLKLADKAADKINKVLDKRFKKEIGAVKINISVRDVLSGGKVGKLFDKYVSDWVEDALKPVMKSLKIKIPTIPGAEKLKDSLSDTVEFTQKIKKDTDSLEEVSTKLTNFFRNRQPAG